MVRKKVNRREGRLRYIAEQIAYATLGLVSEIDRKGFDCEDRIYAFREELEFQVSELLDYVEGNDIINTKTAICVDAEFKDSKYEEIPF